MTFAVISDLQSANNVNLAVIVDVAAVAVCFGLARFFGDDAEVRLRVDVDLETLDVFAAPNTTGGTYGSSYKSATASSGGNDGVHIAANAALAASLVSSLLLILSCDCCVAAFRFVDDLVRFLDDEEDATDAVGGVSILDAD
jgi:hypothetical protein